MILLKNVLIVIPIVIRWITDCPVVIPFVEFELVGFLFNFIYLGGKEREQKKRERGRVLFAD